MDIDRVERQPVDPLAHLLLGALAGAALMFARAEDVETARAEVGQTVLRLLAGSRRRVSRDRRRVLTFAPRRVRNFLPTQGRADLDQWDGGEHTAVTPALLRREPIGRPRRHM